MCLFIYILSFYNWKVGFLKSTFITVRPFLRCTEGKQLCADRPDERKITQCDGIQDEMINSCGREEVMWDPGIGSSLTSAKSIMMCEQVPFVVTLGSLTPGTSADACVHLDRGVKPQIIRSVDDAQRNNIVVKANHCECRIVVESRERTALIGIDGNRQGREVWR